MKLRSQSFAAILAGAVLAPALLVLTGAPANAQDTAAADLFQKKCMTCHAENAPAAIKGPPLKGVFGRAIAGARGYNYSNGLKAKTGVWTDANLNTFLAGPMAFAPGAKMKASLADPAQRAQIIGVLKTLK